jgi:hypothetical protein
MAGSRDSADGMWSLGGGKGLASFEDRIICAALSFGKCMNRVIVGMTVVGARRDRSWWA